MTHGKRILAACYGAAHVEMLLPLIEPLRQRHELTLIGINTAAIALHERGIPFTRVADLVHTLGLDAEVQDWGRRALACSPAALSLSPEESIAYLGMNLRDLALQHGDEAALAIYTQQGRGAFHPIHFARQVLQHMEPDLVLATSAPRLERALIEAASAQGVPSVVLVDQYPHHELQWLATPGFGSRLAVLDDSVRQMIAERGRCAADMVVSGNPAFDVLRDMRHAPRATPRRIVYLSQSEPFAPPGSPLPPPTSRMVLDALLAAADAHDWVIVYRPHPNEPVLPIEHPRLLTHRAGVVDLRDSLRGAAVAVTETSTAGIQALLAGIPLVQLGFTRRQRKPPFARFGTVHTAATVQAIVGAVLQALDTPFDGIAADAQATPRVLTLIEDLLAATDAAHLGRPSPSPTC